MILSPAHGEKPLLEHVVWSDVPVLGGEHRTSEFFIEPYYSFFVCSCVDFVPVAQGGCSSQTIMMSRSLEEDVHHSFAEVQGQVDAKKAEVVAVTEGGLAL